jgi:DMSO/TMAO reductase YedYZ molybdopterin-dependent catalytic subunit
MSLPPGQFYSKNWIIYSALGEPAVDPKSYRLYVEGSVSSPYSLTYDELLELSTYEYVNDFHCVTKWSIKDVHWTGVPLRSLIERASPKPSSDWVLFICLDGYTTPVPLEDAIDSRAIVVTKMNGKPLSNEHGYPARPFIPHLYGWKSAKWLTSIRVRQGYTDGFWETLGYHERGRVDSEERYKGFAWRDIKRSGSHFSKE